MENIKEISEEEKKFIQKVNDAVPIKNYKKILFKHEKELFEKGELKNVTHKGSKAIWLERLSNNNLNEDQTNVYRPCGDKETLYLIENGILPDTQPYQGT